MTYDGRNYFAEIIGISMIVFVILTILFCFYNKMGIFFVLGLFSYFMFFTYRDKKMKKEELNKILYPRESRMVYDRRLPTEIP